MSEEKSGKPHRRLPGHAGQRLHGLLWRDCSAPITYAVAAAIAALILQEKFSPYAAVMRLRACGGLPWVPCERSVYYAVDAGLIGVSRSQLPYRPKGKRRAGPTESFSLSLSTALTLNGGLANTKSKRPWRSIP